MALPRAIDLSSSFGGESTSHSVEKGGLGSSVCPLTDIKLEWTNDACQIIPWSHAKVCPKEHPLHI